MSLTENQIFRISIYYTGESKSDSFINGKVGKRNRVFFEKGRMELKSLLKSLIMGRCGDDLNDEETSRCDNNADEESRQYNDDLKNVETGRYDHDSNEKSRQRDDKSIDQRLDQTNKKKEKLFVTNKI